MEYAYARISTKKQSMERQVRNILSFCPAAAVVREVYTGRKTEGRRELEKLVKRVREGDTVIFDSVSRMSRTADEGFDLYMLLMERGVRLVFLNEPHIGTDVFREMKERQIEIIRGSGDPAADELFDSIIKALNRYGTELLKTQIRIAFEQSKKEVEDLRRRTREGIVTAKLNGKQIGHPRGTRLTTKKYIRAREIIKRHCREFGGSLSSRETWKLAGISKMTFYRYRKRIIVCCKM